MKYLILAAMLAIIPASAFSQASAEKPAKPEFWMMPSPWPDNGGPLRELINKDAGWAQTRKVIDGIGYWPILLNVHFSDKEITQLFAKIKKYNLKFAFEVQVLKQEYPTVDITFKMLEDQMKRFEPLGAKVDRFVFDEPFYATKYVLGKPDSFAIEETAKYVYRLRKKYPNVTIGDVEPYPVLKIDELKTFVIKLNEECAKLGVKGLDFFRVDVDWLNMNNTYAGSWVEVKQLEDFCRSKGMEFSLIYWAAYYPKLDELKLADDMTWYLGIMNQGNMYAAVGGKPDEYVVESWVHVPKRSLPETDKTSFTGSVLDFYNRFLRGK
ncbi:MAG: hypothetical protein ACYC0V_05310 [Armatimonadota bacterium]